MPSWNIHIAHAEGLLVEGGPLAGVVSDRDAFLFGNLVPDIYVGYMVPCVVHPIPYRVTHFAAPEHIPKPREGEFWDAYVAPMARELGVSIGEFAACGRCIGNEAGSLAREVAHVSPAHTPTYDLYVAPMARELGVSIGEFAACGRCIGNEAGSLAREVAHVSPAHTPTYDLTFDPAQSARFQQEAFEPVKVGVGAATDGSGSPRDLFDLVLGTWVHLLADTIWNRRVNDFLDALGEKPSKDFRIKKQGDFDQFGKSLNIDAFPVPTARLVDAAVRFPQYAIDERSVYFTCAIAHEIVRTNSLSVPPAYRLLTEEFFTGTFAEVQSEAERLMRTRLAPCAAAVEPCGCRQDS